MNSIRKTLAGTAIVGVAIVGGYIGAAFGGSAGAQSVDPSTTVPAVTAAAPAAAATPKAHAGGGPHQANGKTETVLTGDDAAKATAAANAAVPGGTIERVETDADGDAFEAHMTKADGSDVTVKMDSSFKVTSVQAGHK